MRVYLNGESKEVSESLTLADLVNELELPAQRIAVELNRTVIRRSEWVNTKITDDDRIEIVHFVGGGATFAPLRLCGIEGSRKGAKTQRTL